jgi:hypothetical protein
MKNDYSTISAEHELFVDDRMIEELSGGKRRLWQVDKHPDNPLFFPARPWEALGTLIHGNVQFDEKEGLWKMWYRAGNGAPKEYAYRTLMCLATSTDGVRWQRPDLGVIGYYTNPDTNIVMQVHDHQGKAPGRFDSISMLEDRIDPDPARRYKALTWQYNCSSLPEGKYRSDVPYPSGLYAAWSPDGLHWVEHPQPVFLMANGTGDTANFMIDRRRKKYVAFLKMFRNLKGQLISRFVGQGVHEYDETNSAADATSLNPEQQFIMRRFRAISESDDFIHWTDPKEIIAPDADDPDDLEWYDNTGFEYGSQYIGFASAFHAATTATIDIQLITSRDGTNWERCFDRTPIIPTGQMDRDWDGGCHIMPTSPPVRVGDKLYIHYASRWSIHSTHFTENVPVRTGKASTGQIGLATLRVDGFVSVNATNKKAELITKPLYLSGDNLEVNVNAEKGELRVGVLDEDCNPLPGLSINDCNPISGDCINAQVNWKNGAGQGKINDLPVRLKFEITNADLYSFWTT